MYRFYYFDEDGNPQEELTETKEATKKIEQDFTYKNIPYGVENLSKEQYKIRHNNRYRKFDTVEQAQEFKIKNNLEEYACIELWTLDDNNKWQFQDFIEDYEEE